MARSSLTQRILRRWRGLSIFLGAVVAVNVLLHVLVVRKLVAASGDSEVILSTQRERLSAKVSELEQLEKAASKLACVESDLEDVSSLLSSKEARMARILRELRLFERKHKVKIGKFSLTNDEVREGELIRFSVSFSFEGNYEKMRAFIADLEESENFLIVEQVTLHEEKGAAQDQDLVLQLKIASYFAPPNHRRRS
ncbi:MAG: type 4a pilus biogenesis protein PilO [Acidobacteriota bacterium]